MADEPSQKRLRVYRREANVALTAVLDANREQMMGFAETAGFFLFAVVSCPQAIMPSEWTKGDPG